MCSKIDDKKNTYDMRLKKLNLCLLENRRKRNVLCLMQKIRCDESIPTEWLNKIEFKDTRNGMKQ